MAQAGLSSGSAPDASAAAAVETASSTGKDFLLKKRKTSEAPRHWVLFFFVFCFSETFSDKPVVRRFQDLFGERCTICIRTKQHKTVAVFNPEDPIHSIGQFFTVHRFFVGFDFFVAFRALLCRLSFTGAINPFGIGFQVLY